MDPSDIAQTGWWNLDKFTERVGMMGSSIFCMISEEWRLKGCCTNLWVSLGNVNHYPQLPPDIWKKFPDFPNVFPHLDTNFTDHFQHFTRSFTWSMIFFKNIYPTFPDFLEKQKQLSLITLSFQVFLNFLGQKETLLSLLL